MPEKRPYPIDDRTGSRGHPPSKHSRTLSLKLSESFEREIETCAERKGLSKFSLVGKAVREFLVREDAAMPGAFSSEQRISSVRSIGRRTCQRTGSE